MLVVEAKTRDEESDIEIRLLLDDLHFHLNPLFGIICSVSGLADDFVCDFHARHHLAEDSILLVEEEGVSHTDEEL